MSRTAQILLIIMLITDICTFVPAFAGLAGAAFLWDDPTVEAYSWTGLLRVVLTLLLMAAAPCVVGNFLLVGETLRRRCRINAVTWATFLPPLLITGGIVYLVAGEVQDTLKTHRAERSYEVIVAAPQMSQFHNLTKDLSPYVRLALALRAQKRLNEQGISPPDTVDELYADEYRVMLDQAEALKHGSISKSEYDIQRELEWEYELETSTKLGRPNPLLEKKFFDLRY